MVRASSLYLEGSWFESRQADMDYSGVVIRGDGYGRKLGYPTANIEIEEAPQGIFAGHVVYEGKDYDAAVFVTARRPHILEAHLLDFDGDMYGKPISVALLEKIRDDAQFENEDELIAAIAQDAQAVRDYFRRT